MKVYAVGILLDFMEFQYPNASNLDCRYFTHPRIIIHQKPIIGIVCFIPDFYLMRSLMRMVGFSSELRKKHLLLIPVTQ